MVDFQSRDTRRGVSDADEEDEDETADETEQATDEPVGEDDSEIEETDAESESPDAVTQDDDPGATTTETTDDTSASAGVGISAADPSSADETDSQDESPPAETATSGESAPASESAPSSAGQTADGTETVDEPTEPAEVDQADETPSETESADGQSVTPSRSLGIALVTVGDSTESREEALGSVIESNGHELAVSQQVAGGYDEIQQVVDELVSLPAVDVVVTTGGIGITPEERTIEAVHPLLEKALPGFGEVFRHLLFEEIGTGIVAVRSTAGITDGTLVFCLPVDAAAAQLAMEEIVATEAPELVAHLDE